MYLLRKLPFTNGALVRFLLLFDLRQPKTTGFASLQWKATKSRGGRFQKQIFETKAEAYLKEVLNLCPAFVAELL